MFKLLREKRSGKQPSDKNKSNVGTLERKTAEIKEKLGRLSFGSIRKPHHSAPSIGTDCIYEGREGSDASEIRRRDSHPAQPVVLDGLPQEIMELVLERTSLRDLARGAVLVHSTWHRYILSDAFVRQRLEGELPPQLLRFLEHWHGSWADRAQAFYNYNLLENPEFKAGGVTNATGLGKVLETSRPWRAQVGCWQVEKEGLGRETSRLARNAGTRGTPRALVLSTPSWAIPEAAQEVDLVGALVDRGFTKAMAAAFLDTSPTLTFSVWCLCNTGQPMEWQRGFAAIVFDNGEDSGTGWRGLKMGSHISRTDAAAFWISWAPDSSLLKGSHSLAKEVIHTPRGQYKRLACRFSGYSKGVRRAQILLKGLDPKLIYAGNGKELKATDHKPNTEFVAPSLRFCMPDV